MEADRRALVGVLLSLVLPLAGCSSIINGGSGDANGFIEITILKKSENIKSNGRYHDSSVSNLTFINEMVLNAFEDAEEVTSSSDSSLATVSEELTQEEIQKTRNKLQTTTPAKPSKSSYPSGSYFSHDDWYVVFELYIYD